MIQPIPSFFFRKRWVKWTECFLENYLHRNGDPRKTCPPFEGVLAQSVRAPPCHGGGCGFEPRRLRQPQVGEVGTNLVCCIYSVCISDLVCIWLNFFGVLWIGLWIWRKLSFESSDGAQTVVFKITEAVSSALDPFHLSVEAFGDAVVFGKAPHSGDLLFPVLKGRRQSLHRFKSRSLKLPKDRQEPLTPLTALELGLMLLIQRVCDSVNFIVDNSEGGMRLKNAFQEGLLLGCEFWGEPCAVTPNVLFERQVPESVCGPLP
ncbi:MAG: hypothetical protein RLZZ399_2489 [Verrucomicrobiota bacterium]